MQVLKGAVVSAMIKEEVQNALASLNGFVPKLAIVRVGENPDDLSYERGALKKMEAFGLRAASYAFPADISHEEFKNEFLKINRDEDVTGILLLRPLPRQIDEAEIERLIDPDKDLDGISPVNIAKVFAGDTTGFAPCTAEAVIEVLKANQIPVKGKRVTIVGRSMVVGKPLAMLMLKENGTVTVCHTKTQDLKGTCRQAEILVAAAGRAKMLDGEYIGQDAVVIDVGINVDENGKLCGDVDFESIQDRALMATPVPGGVGTVTTAVLGKHLAQAAVKQGLNKKGKEPNTMKLGALEAGGTKMVCAIGNENGEIFERVSIPTETPEVTLPKIVDYFKDKGIEALGIGCFGPIDLNRNSDTYGYITTTPKLAWVNCNIVGILKEALGVPVGFDTDVNGSALGEATWGITKGLENSMYITIGTGIGAGVISNGKLLHGMLHPEAGHVLLRKHPDDHYEGKCPYHKTCLEGLAAGPAIEARWGKKGVELADRKEVWEMEAFYIAQALVDYIVVLSPQRIVLGGGVMHQEHMMPLVREEVKKQLNGYLKTKELEDLESYIVLPSLDDNQGIMGALKLALDELNL